jgi:hypothetical protein
MVTIEEQVDEVSIPAPKLPKTPRSIPIFGRDAAIRIQALTERYQLQGDTELGDALMKIYFNHHELWLPHAQDARASMRAAAKINFATKKYMSLLSRNITIFAHLLTTAAAPTDDSRLAMGDVNTLTLLLRRLLFNSYVAKGAKSARGRGRDPLAVTVAAKLGRFYDKCCPASALERSPMRTRTMSAPRSRKAPRKHRRAPASGRLEGESRSSIRAQFVREAAAMLGVRLTEDSVLTYRKKKHQRRVRS